MEWYERIIAVHTAVASDVGHGRQLKKDRYFVWQEDGADDYEADGKLAERAMTGTTDLFSKTELDPWKAEFEASIGAAPRIAWHLNSVQFEPDTGFWHWEWVWTVS